VKEGTAEEPRGFAGFEALVTDLSDLRWNDGQVPPFSSPPPRRRPPSTPYGSVRTGVRIIAGLIFLTAVFRGVSGPRPPSVPGQYQTGNPASYQVAPPSSASTTSLTSRSYVPAPAPATIEERPPVAQGATLSAPQVRYCLAQGIRIQAADKAVNTASAAETRRFIALVDDYTPRCGNYKYALAVLQSVKAEVEARRAVLEREGVALLGKQVDEEKPPAGQSAQLSLTQLRYCLRQGIRITGAAKQRAVNAEKAAFKPEEAIRFLVLFEDYNARCGANYLSELPRFPGVQEEAEARREALEREGAELLRAPAGPQ
jgi:hypothetical protein